MGIQSKHAHGSSGQRWGSLETSGQLSHFSFLTTERTGPNTDSNLTRQLQHVHYALSTILKPCAEGMMSKMHDMCPMLLRNE